MSSPMVSTEDYSYQAVTAIVSYWHRRISLPGGSAHYGFWRQLRDDLYPNGEGKHANS
jgi:hypothetical protein